MKRLVLKYYRATDARTMQEHFMGVELEEVMTKTDLKEQFCLIDAGLLYGVTDIIRLYREPLANLYFTKLSDRWYQLDKDMLAKYYDARGV